MEFSTITHVEPAALLDFHADLFITTLGFETRGTHIARLIHGKKCRKIALARTDHPKEHAFGANKVYFAEEGFEMISVESGIPDLESILSDWKDSSIRIILDCTSMSPRWYYEFLQWFSESQDRFEEVHLRITYTMASYSGSDHSRKVKGLYNLTENLKANSDFRQKALILGLGHEKQIGSSIYQAVKPDLLYLFYADPPVHKEFVEKVFVNNHALIESTPIRNLIAYPIHNGQKIYQSLIDTILPLRHKYDVIMVPHGPKIFSLVTMLVYMGYPDTLISYPDFKKPPSADRIASGEPVLLDLLFESED
ncbi:MAG: hypothetical protein ACWGNV_12970 [Bacteroidales bacterium]